ncbi:class I adenylate-forming enzyme family protein [Alicyclobacillus sendaiensis]|uniref:class I adenylate-forming enzyme family protein n=1 Tax=Alicyclobacillus sendaiensis TaxID=192387 RepID=UPI0026F462ED|nr:AMP-binding protein [Alicyclobacillus sendaiensis]
MERIFTYPAVIEAQAARRGDAPYLVWKLDGDRPETLSYREYQQACAAVSAWLEAEGIQAGHRVALALDNSPEMVVAYGAVTSMGAIAVPINPTLSLPEMTFILQDVEASAFIGAPDRAEALAANREVTSVERWLTPDVLWRHVESGGKGLPHHAEVRPDSTAMILYTSGTTGRPKGVMLSHEGVLRTAQTVCDYLESTEGERILNLLPMTHCFSICVEILHALLAGGTLFIRSGTFAPRAVLGEIERHRVTFICGVPSIFMLLNEALKRHPVDVSSLRVGLVGGAPVPVETIREFEAQTGIVIVEGYGQTELSPLATLQPPHPDERRLSSCGLPIPGTEVRIVDAEGRDVPVGEPGELLVRGFNVMQGYWRQPERTAETIEQDGWLHTGDVFRQDADGYLYAVDRLKDVIIYGGFNIYPKEVESVLYRHRSVLEAYVVGAPDALKGEIPVAFVRIDESADPSAVQAELEALCREELAPYKRPRRYHFVDTFPKTSTGKVLRRELRHMAAER